MTKQKNAAGEIHAGVFLKVRAETCRKTAGRHNCARPAGIPVFRVSTPPAKSRIDRPSGRLNPLSHRERVGERGSIQQTLLLDSYPLFLAFSRGEKESFF